MAPRQQINIFPVTGRSPEFYGALAAVIPALAYPLLPTDEIEDVLFVSSLFNICLHIWCFLLWLGGFKSCHFGFWVLPLVLFSFHVGLVVSEFERNQEANLLQYSSYFFRDTSSSYLDFASLWFCKYAFSHGARILCSLIPGLHSTRNFFRQMRGLHKRLVLLTLVLGILYARWLGFLGFLSVHLVFKKLVNLLSVVFARLVTRSVPGWFWFADGVFEPLRSQALAAFVMISQLVLVCLCAERLHHES